MWNVTVCVGGCHNMPPPPPSSILKSHPAHLSVWWPWPWPLTLELVCDVTHGTDNLPANFVLLQLFSVELWANTGQTDDLTWRNLDFFDLWGHSVCVDDAGHGTPSVYLVWSSEDMAHLSVGINRSCNIDLKMGSRVFRVVAALLPTFSLLHLPIST